MKYKTLANKKILLTKFSVFAMTICLLSISTQVVAKDKQPSTRIVQHNVETPTISDSIDTTKPLTLQEVLLYVLNHNPYRAQNWAAYKAAIARIGSAKADGGLQVNLSGNAEYRRGFGRRVGSFVPGSNSSNHAESLAIDGTIPIYTGGRVKASRQIATYNAERVYAEALAFEQDLVFNTTLNYVDVLRSDELLKTANANVDVATEQLRVAKVRFTAGVAARLELMRAETDLANAQQNLVITRNNVEHFKANLNTLMGRQPETPISLVAIDNLTLPEEFYFRNEEGIDRDEASKLADVAEGRNQNINLAEAQVRAAEAGVNLARAQRRPSVGLSLTGLLSNPVGTLGRFLLSLGGSVAQNLFDSGRSRSQINEARAIVEQTEHNLVATQLGVANQVEQSILALNTALQQQESARSAVTSAQEALRATMLGYTAGVNTSLEVSTAQAALLAAQTNAVNARFDVAAAQAQLAAAVGIYPEEGKTAYEQATSYRTIALKKEKKK